jgi:UDP-glucose 4-epimerase
MNILITGGYGFIGSNLTKHFLKDKKNSITIIDNLSTADKELPSKLKDERVTFVNIDLSKPTEDEIKEIRQIVQNCDLVYHMAASVGVKYIDKNPKDTLQNSFKINNILFSVFEKYHKKVIYASTSEVYGNTEEARETDDLQIGPPTTLRWGYACSKLMSEFLISTYNFPYVIVRFFNVTGEGQLPDHGMVLPTFIQNVKENKPITIYGTGDQYRSFCDIRDVVEVLNILGKSDIHNGEIYNVGNPRNTVTIMGLANLINNIGPNVVPIVLKKYEEEFSKDFGDIMRRKPNTDKIELYYQFKYSIKDIIKSML